MYITELNSLKSDQPVSNISVQRLFLPQNVKHVIFNLQIWATSMKKKQRMVIMKYCGPFVLP